MLNNEVLDIVDNLNSELLMIEGNELDRKNEEGVFLFDFRSDGTCCAVAFLGKRVWDSENEEREFIEAEDEYEPLEGYLKKMANKFIEQAEFQKYDIPSDNFCSEYNGKCQCLICKHDNSVCVSDPCADCDGDLSKNCEYFKGESPQLELDLN